MPKGTVFFADCFLSPFRGQSLFSALQIRMRCGDRYQGLSIVAIFFKLTHMFNGHTLANNALTCCNMP